MLENSIIYLCFFTVLQFYTAQADQEVRKIFDKWRALGKI